MNNKTFIIIFCMAAVLILSGAALAQISKEEKHSNKKLNLDYFVMSPCPFGNQVENQMMAPLYDKMKKYVNFNPHYVIYSGGSQWDNCATNGNSTFCFLFGLSEFHQDVREVCIKNSYGLNKYYDFVTNFNTQCTLNNAETCWKNIANSERINVQLIESCQNTNQYLIAEQELEATQQFGVQGSPTIFINGNKYTGERTEEALASALCSAMNGNKPKICR